MLSATVNDEKGSEAREEEREKVEEEEQEEKGEEVVVCPARGEGRQARVRLANIRANYWPGRDEMLEGNSESWKYQDRERPQGY